MSDKRTVATDALDTLGTAPLADTAARDAIHLAVDPVVAGELLCPADHITLRDGKAFRTTPGKGLGIVDPFVLGELQPGDRFWFVVYPRTIRSLRHVWEHPSFPSAVAVPADAARAESEQWLREWAESHDIPAEHVLDVVRSNEGWGSSKQHDDISTGDLFWYHAERFVGVGHLSRFDYFSCEC